jgi:flagellar protein FlbD
VIVLTRLDGQRIGINDEQLERVEETPTTVLTLVNGHVYTVLEGLEEVLEAILVFRAQVLVRAGALDAPSPSSPAAPAERRAGRAHLVPLPEPGTDGSG